MTDLVNILAICKHQRRLLILKLLQLHKASIHRFKNLTKTGVVCDWFDIGTCDLLTQTGMSHLRKKKRICDCHRCVFEDFSLLGGDLCWWVSKFQCIKDCTALTTLGTTHPFRMGHMPGKWNLKCTYFGLSNSWISLSRSLKHPRLEIACSTSGSIASMEGIMCVCTTSIIGSSNSNSPFPPAVTHGWRFMSASWKKWFSVNLMCGWPWIVIQCG